MLNSIKQMIDEFITFQSQSPNWLPSLINLTIVFLSLILINYIFLIKSNLMNKILYVHNFIPVKDDEYNSRHFHNTDLINGNYDIKPILYNERFGWVGKHYLFIPNGRLNTLTKKGNQLTVWYNGNVSKGFKYKVKHLQKDWKERKLNKKQIVNYNGTFIIGNLMVKTSNLLSLKVDSIDKRNFTLTYLFNNGSERVIMISTLEFFENMIDKVLPYNIAFLNQCDVIELR